MGMRIENFENFDFNLVEVIMNNSCPLDCSYCFLENHGEAENMELETFKNVLRMCKQAQEVHPQEYISVMPSLKEPMLSWNIIKRAIDELEFDIFDYKIFITINTNGVLITQDILRYCREKMIDLHISLDGPQDIHDRGRVYRGNKTGSSWEKVMKLIEDNPNREYMSYMTTIHKQDLGRITEIFNFMSNLPIQCWVYALNKFDDWDDEALAQLESEIKAFIDNATPLQLQRTRFQKTAAAFPNINVINGLKIHQDGTVCLQPPTPNDGAIEGEFTRMVTLGNVNNVVTIPDKYKNLTYKDYEIIGPNCQKEKCPLYSFCSSGKNNNKKIYVSDFSCRRVQHFNRMATYAKGGNMELEKYESIRNTTPIFNAVINVTDNCNLRCPYCFTEHNTRVIDMGTMKAAIMFVLHDIDRFDDFKGEPCFNFFGGEPMLHFEDIIKPTVLWTEETGLRDKYKINFGMTSNGTLFTEENLQWLQEHQVSILLSIDGDKETQDSQRPGANGQSSFDMLAPKIPMILKYYPWVTFRSAIQPFNVDKMFENYLFARKQGFVNYFITPNIDTDWTIEEIQKACEQLAMIAATIYRDISLGMEPLVWADFFVAIKNLFVQREAAEISFNHCGIGTTTIGVACNGDINGCQEHNTYLEHDIFHIGNVFTGLDPVKHMRLLDAFSEYKHPVCKENPSLCDTCSFYNDCAGNYCPSHNISNGQKAVENKLVTCLWKGFMKDLAISILEQADRDNNEAFVKYLENMFFNEDKFSNFQLW